MLCGLDELCRDLGKMPEFLHRLSNERLFTASRALLAEDHSIGACLRRGLLSERIEIVGTWSITRLGSRCIRLIYQIKPSSDGVEVEL